MRYYNNLCPKKGPFIAYKLGWLNVINRVPAIIKLEIPADAIVDPWRFRADRAKVIEIMTLDEKPAKEKKARALWLCNFVYPLNETVYAADGTGDWCRSSGIYFFSGIHFFTEFRDVINYLEDLSELGLMKYE